MEPIYLIWDTSDYAGDGLDCDGNARRQGRTVLIRLTKEDAVRVAMHTYMTDHVTQLVVELLPDGTRKIVCFVGVMDGKLLEDYLGVKVWIGHEADRAMAAALVVLANNVDRARC